MKTTHCRECKKEISPTVSVCPHCGAEIPGKSSLRLTVNYSLFFVILGAIMFGLFNFG